VIVLKKFGKKIYPVLYILSIIFLWWLWSLITNKELFAPSPKATLNVIIDLFNTGAFYKHLSSSFIRVTTGILIATIVSLPLGMLMAWNKTVGELLRPIVDSLKFAPVTCFQSLLVLYFGIGEEMKISLVTIACIFSFLPTVLQICEDNTDETKKLIETAYTMGFSYPRMLFHCLIPYITPSLVLSFINLYAVGWTYVVIAETNNTQYGLGHLMYIGGARGKTAMVFASIIILFLFSKFFNLIAIKITKRIFKWRIVDEEKKSET